MATIAPRTRLAFAAIWMMAGVGCRRAPADQAAPPITALTPATHTRFPIATGVHAVSCDQCHGAFDSFKQFDCLGCHAHEQTVTEQLHHSVTAAGGTLPDGGGSYAYASASCYACHATGARVPFDHAGVTASCATCHGSGAQFDPLPVAGVGLDGGAFTHIDMGGNDCRACHTIQSWSGASGAPDGVRDPQQDVAVTAWAPAYAGTSMVGATQQTEKLPMPMVHSSPQVPAGLSCIACHAGANTAAFYPGVFHASVTAAAAPQPSQCLGCHATSVPTGFVGPPDASRTPQPTGEMKHDAVTWLNGKPSQTAIVTQDCAVCHVTGASWSTSLSYHASIAAQPSSCLDCHASSRHSPTAALQYGIIFDHASAGAMGDCVTCHSSKTTWSGGKYHATNPAPASCLPCHSAERPTSSVHAPATWTGTSPPFDRGDVAGTNHGAGQDCVLCHASGATSAWSGGAFNHARGALDATTCIACHATQRPDLQSPAIAVTYNGQPFDHSQNGAGDCIGCHTATINRGTYATYTPPGDWQGGVGYPGATLISAQTFLVTELQLVKSGAFVTGATSVSAPLYGAMLHDDPAAIPAEVYPGPASSPDNTKCWHCHVNDGAGHVTSFANGQFHASLTSYQATPGGAFTDLGQPTGHCADCHSGAKPSGIVQLRTSLAPSGSDLQPMDHAAALNGGSLATMDCSSCHTHPGATCTPSQGATCWADGAFHAKIGSATPQDCTTCHFPLMADPVSDVKVTAKYQMNHTHTSQMPFQNCLGCHLSANTASLASTAFAPGNFHTSVQQQQPAQCNDCHVNATPTTVTKSNVTYTLALGGTSSNQNQWMNHASPNTVGKDCAVCHLADAAPGVTDFNHSDTYHLPGLVPGSCSDCHGLGNGSTVIGTNNNLPAGLTNSSFVSSAGSDPSTGIPSGTHDQITHADLNATSHDCNFCHTQPGGSWAQGQFHASFTGANPLVMNRTTGRCSNCHMNVKPTSQFTAFDHSALTSASGTQDCNSCHTWPGTGTASAPNWLGATGAPALVTLTGFTSPSGDLTNTSRSVTFSHPAAATYTSCAQCHLGSDYSHIIDYNHDGLTTNVSINGVPAATQPNLGSTQYNASTNPTFCVYCHDSGTSTTPNPWVSRTGLTSTITANTTSGSTTVTTASTAALTVTMTVTGSAIPTSSSQSFTGTTTSGSLTVTTASPVTLRGGSTITGTGIPSGDKVATSVTNATSFSLTIAATASGTTTLTVTTSLPAVTITSIPSATTFVLSAAPNVTATGTSLSVTHKSCTQERIGNHPNPGDSVSGQDCTSCHYTNATGNLAGFLKPPTPGVFGSGTISGL